MQRRHCAALPSAGWRPVGCCCSLFRMMLMMSPSCSFMCSSKRSLLVDSKPQMQQQKSSTQYSMPGTCPAAAETAVVAAARGGRGAAPRETGVIVVIVVWEEREASAPDNWDSSAAPAAVGIAWAPVVVGEGVGMVAAAVKVVGVSTGPRGMAAWSRGEPTADRSPTGSSMADSFWGALATTRRQEVIAGDGIRDQLHPPAPTATGLINNETRDPH